MIKEATLKDLDSIKEFRDKLYEADSNFTNISTIDNIKSTILNDSVNNNKYYLFWKNNEIIGQAIIRVNIKSTIGHLGHIAVLKEYYGKGIADELLKKVIQYSKDIKLNSIELIVDETNIRAIKFYEKYQFKYEKKRRINSSLVIYKLTLIVNKYKTSLIFKW